MVFDEASSWWSPQKEELPDSKEIEDRLQEKLREQIVEIRLSPEAVEEEQIDEEHEEIQSPSRTGVYQPEEVRPSEEEVVSPHNQNPGGQLEYTSQIPSMPI